MKHLITIFNIFQKKERERKVSLFYRKNPFQKGKFKDTIHALTRKEEEEKKTQRGRIFYKESSDYESIVINVFNCHIRRIAIKTVERKKQERERSRL